MKLIQRIWSDFRAGENIDQYLSIILAITLVILNLLGFSFQDYFSPFILSILALMAINSLGNRHKIEELITRLSKTADSFFLTSFPLTYHKEVENCDVLWLFGVSLRRMIKTNYAIYEKKLKKGHHIKVLLVNPEGAGVEMSVARTYAHQGVVPKSNDIIFVLNLLCNLKKIAPNHLEIRTIQFPLAYSAIAIDPNTSSGKLYINQYSFRPTDDTTPRYLLKVADGRWYEFHLKELLALWNEGEEWSCDKKINL
ncbi:MAG: hypothetical protein KGZ88_19470 [Methylomicrobium sp.]|nr:hypothetical protein [Methylomicrobium sp.]